MLPVNAPPTRFDGLRSGTALPCQQVEGSDVDTPWRTSGSEHFAAFVASSVGYHTRRAAPLRAWPSNCARPETCPTQTTVSTPRGLLPRLVNTKGSSVTWSLL